MGKEALFWTSSCYLTYSVVHTLAFITSRSQSLLIIANSFGKKSYGCNEYAVNTCKLLMTIPERTHAGKKSQEYHDFRRALPSELKLIAHQQLKQEWDPTDVINVIKPSLQIQVLCIIRKLIIEKGKSVHAVNVEKFSLGSQNSFYIKEIIQERDHSFAKYVIKASWLGHISLYIRELTQERNHMLAQIVRKPSQKRLYSWFISESTQERYLINVFNVKQLWRPDLSSVIIRKFFIEKENSRDAVNVGKLFLGSQTSFCISELIQERDLSGAKSVIKPSLLEHS